MVGRLPFYNQDHEIMFENILASDVRFPSKMSDNARDLLTGLLVKEPARRLGGGPEGAKEIMRHIFFETIDWMALQEKKISPPFKPQVLNETDTRNFDIEFTGESVELTPPEDDNPLSEYGDLGKYIIVFENTMFLAYSGTYIGIESKYQFNDYLLSHFRNHERRRCRSWRRCSSTV